MNKKEKDSLTTSSLKSENKGVESGNDNSIAKSSENQTNDKRSVVKEDELPPELDELDKETINEASNYQELTSNNISQLLISNNFYFNNINLNLINDDDSGACKPPFDTDMNNLDSNNNIIDNPFPTINVINGPNQST